MFGGWLPSIFGRRRDSERDDEDSSDSPTSAAAVRKRSKSKSRDSNKSSRAQEEDLLVEKWTVACLNSVMLPAHQELSSVFAPLPMLALFCIIWMGATDEVRKHMNAVCGMDKKSLTDFSALLSRIISLLNKDSLLVYRVLTTPDQIPTIDPIFTTKLQKRFGRRALIPADRDKQRDYIRTNTKRIICDLSIPSSTGLLGFAAASVVEKWQAETRPYPDRPFALSQLEKQQHEYFEMRGVMRMLREERIDSCLLPFRDSPLALAILRPTERTGLVRLRRELTAKELHTTLKKLGEQKPAVGRVLLPRFELRSCEPSLLPKWRLSGVLSERVRLRKKGGERVFPPFREISAGASIRIDERGVNAMAEERTRPRSVSTASSSTHSYYSAALDVSLDPNFNLRLDSPFIFFVVHTESMASILAGTYAGNALITPYTRSVSVSKSKSSKSFARKSINVISRPLRKVRASTRSARESSNSQEIKKSEKKEWKGVPKCEECEERSKKSGGKSRKSMQSNAAAPATHAPVIRSPVPPAYAAAAAAASSTSQKSARQSKHESVRETLKETHRSTREGVYRTISAGRSTTYAAKDGLVKAAKIGGDKMGKGLDKTKQTAVRIAGKTSEKAKRAKTVVSSTAKSIGRAINNSSIISHLSRSQSESRSVEEDIGKSTTRESTDTSERLPIHTRKTTVSESSRKAKEHGRAATSTQSNSDTRSSKSAKNTAAAISKPKQPAAAPDSADKPQPSDAPTKSIESSFEVSKATAKSTGREVARNVKKGLSKAKVSMKKMFGKIAKRSKNEDDSGK